MKVKETNIDNIMKNTFKYILAAAALVSGLTAFAQNLPEGTYQEKNGLAFRKGATLKPGTTDRYIIDLEAFVTGEVTVEQVSVPADVVLVLDVSGSMADPYTYEARSSQAYSYNGYGNSVYYYKHTDGKYYRVRQNTGSSGGLFARTYYRLRYQVGNQWYYLSGTGTTTSAPTNITSNTATIWTGVLYSVKETKLDALKTAVGAFIDKIQENDLYEKDEDGNLVRRKGKSGADTTLGNQIAIVKFAGNRYVGMGTNTAWNSANAPTTVSGTGNNHYDSGNNSYNYTEVVRAFTKTGTQANVTDLKNAVNAFDAAGATSADYGMNLAYLLINKLPGEGQEGDRSGSAKTVVFFTDGSPTHSSGFETDVATNTISRAYNAKKTYDAKVFTVGVFDETTTNISTFMNYASSNYPDATSFSQGGTPIAEADRVYFQDASDPNSDLTVIFTTIAEASGGSGNTDVAGGSAVTVDVVSSSFALPAGTTANDITVLVAKCHGDTTINGNTYLAFDKPVAPGSAGFTITPSVNTETNMVSTTGFDFSEQWCGYDEENVEYHGYKQIIRFEIKVNDDAVGGPEVVTNDDKSGIYVNGEQIAKFNKPNVEIPISIWIKKKGLEGDDTAVFNIEYADYVSGQNPADLPKEAWKNFDKIPINENCEHDPEDGCPIVRLVGLNPHFFYRIREDKWAWSYSYQDGGIQYTSGTGGANPFVFVNLPKETVKENESSIRNVFNERTESITTTTTTTGGNTTP